MKPTSDNSTQGILDTARSLRKQTGTGLHDRITESLYAQAAKITERSIRVGERPRVDWDQIADAILTSRLLGYPIMMVGLAAVLWMTITGSNAPSAVLFDALFWIHDALEAWMISIGAPWWLTGFLVNGVYRGLAWVVAVMLPPMAIFFPIFTLLEDIGYLPRVAFNVDRLFRWCGAHGKQALTMSMGFGCNAAGVAACRIIDSPRERLIAIVTNNFMLCNGRWPTIIMLATVFLVADLPSGLSSLVATGAVVGVTLLGVAVTFAVSKVLSQTVLKGERSHFYLELPPYRRPNVLRVIHRSIVDRTLFVLGRACVTAAPAGALIWILGNVHVGNVTIMAHMIGWLDPAASLIGLDGVILLAYIVALPANEIIVPTMIMAYMAKSSMIELDNMAALGSLFQRNGWTITTAACMMLFALLHYPCATTTWTIYRETRSWKWTIFSNIMPLGLAIIACAIVAQVSRLFGA